MHLSIRFKDWNNMNRVCFSWYWFYDVKFLQSLEFIRYLLFGVAWQSSVHMGCCTGVIFWLFFLGGGVELSKNWVTWGIYTKNFAGMGETTLKRDGWCRKGRLPLFYYFTVQLHLLCVWCGGGGSKVSLILVLQSFDLTMQGSHPSLYIKTLYDLHISDLFW